MINLRGNSGCKLGLVFGAAEPRLVKSNGRQLDLDYHVLQTLAQVGLNVPKYYSVQADCVSMQYLDGISMYDYLNGDYDLARLIEFCYSCYVIFQHNSTIRDVGAALRNKFIDLDSKIPASIKSQLAVNLDDLYHRMPKAVPIGLYHGDLTLENMIFYENKFYLVDANHTPLPSVAFDFAKLRQDLDCRWFVRHRAVSDRFINRLATVRDALRLHITYMNDDNLLTFMLLRVLPYTKQKEDQEFLINSINQLWT